MWSSFVLSAASSRRVHLTTLSVEGESKKHPLEVSHYSQLCPASHVERILKLSGRMEKSAGLLEVMMPPCAVKVGLDNSITILHKRKDKMIHRIGEKKIR